MAALSLVVASACESKSTTAPSDAPAPTTTPTDSPLSTPPSHGDAELAREVTLALLRDPAVDRGSLDVEVVDGIVSLVGRVESLLAKERATRIAESIRGTRSVSNRLAVDTDDVAGDELMRRVVAVLEGDPHVEYPAQLDIEIENGAVVLTGSVDSWAERMHLERIVSSVNGVRRIDNRLGVTVSTDRSDEELSEDVRARLRWDVLVDHALVRVTVDDGVVELAGKVGSAAEKRRATTDAMVMGVQRVRADDLSVEPWLDGHDMRAAKYASVSDDAIRDAIEDAAVYDPRLMAYDINPKVDGGVVTLYGKVPTLEAKRAAVDLARHTAGVMRVADELELAFPEPASDRKVEDEVEAALRFNPYTSSHEIDASVAHGLVRLEGGVGSAIEKAQAEAVASRVSGVQDVDNDLVVPGIDAVWLAYEPWLGGYAPLIGDWQVPEHEDGEPHLVPSDETLQRSVEQHLFWNPYASSWDIVVSAKDGMVTLEGSVDSWAERAAAEGSARQAGALSVDNDLTVDPS